MDGKRKSRAVNNIPADSQVQGNNKQISYHSGSSPDLVIKALSSRNPISDHGKVHAPIIKRILLALPLLPPKELRA